VSNDTIICPGCGWIGSIDRLDEGACPDCAYENNTPPHWRLLTIGELLSESEPTDYCDMRMDLFLQSLLQVVGRMAGSR